MPRFETTSRRKFLAAGLCAAAGASAQRAGAEARKKRIIVVGGGLAGLNAAEALSQRGCSVLVLEANASVGGRVKSVRDFLPGKVLEAGGELIGPNQPNWMAAAKRFELELVPATDPANDGPTPVVIDGKRLAPAAAAKVLEEVEQLKHKLAEESQSVDPLVPWRHANAKTLDAQSLAGRLRNDSDLSPETRKLLEAYFGHYNGVPVEQQSLLAVYASLAGGGHDRFWTQTDTLRCQGGAQQLASRLTEALGKEQLRLSSVVTAIRAEDRGVSVEVGKEQLRADEVILALPPRVLARLRMEPKLVLPTFQMGNAVKHLLVTRDRSWRPDSPDALLDAGATWETTAGQPGPSHALLLLQSNAAAQRLCAARPEERLKLSSQAVAPAYPELHATKDVLYDWNGNERSLGSYSFPRPGQITRVRNSGRTLLPGKIHCAGEHLSYAFPGYMEGALASGLAAAEAIVERL